MAAISQTKQDKAGLSMNVVEVDGTNANGFFLQLGSIHIGIGTGSPNGEFKYVVQASQAFTNKVLNGVEAGSLYCDIATGQWYCNDGGTSETSTDWTAISTAMS